MSTIIDDKNDLSLFSSSLMTPSLSLSLSPSNKMNKKQIVWSNADLLGTHELLNFAYLYVHIIEKDQHSWLCRNLSGLLEEI